MGSDVLRPSQGSADDILVDTLDEADAFGLSRVQWPAAEEDLRGALAADHAGKQPGDAVLRHQAEAAERRDEARGRRGEAHVTGEGNDESESRSRAIHRHDDGDPHVECSGGEVIPRCLRDEPLEGLGSLGQDGEIRSRAEAAPRARDDSDPNAWVSVCLSQGSRVGRTHVGGEGVEPLGSVQCDERDAVTDLDEHGCV